MIPTKRSNDDNTIHMRPQTFLPRRTLLSLHPPPVKKCLTQGSPCILPTTAPLSHLDLRELATLLERSGHGDLVSLETWSRDAGAYYCNDQFYRTLHAIRMDAHALSPGNGIISLVPVNISPRQQ